MIHKKGSLSLSIEAIVIIVIAFVVLGLGLGLTKTIFKGAEQKLPEAFAVTQLEAEPTAANPITISQNVEIRRGSEKTMNLGFYNKGSSTFKLATFVIEECLNKDQVPVLKQNLPVMASISQDVSANTAAGFSVILTEKELGAETTYICTLSVCEKDDVGCIKDNVESKQFFLTVTS